jgi:hypothetical protein
MKAPASGKLKVGPKAPKTAVLKPQRAVWSGVKRKGGVSPLQLHLPGLGGVIH